MPLSVPPSRPACHSERQRRISVSVDSDTIVGKYQSGGRGRSKTSDRADIRRDSHLVYKKRFDTSAYSTSLPFRLQRSGVEKSHSEVIQATVLLEILGAYKRSKGCKKLIEHFFTSLFKHMDTSTSEVEEMNRF